MTRPVEEIVASFARLRRANGWSGDLEHGLLDDGKPIAVALEGIRHAKEVDEGQFLFIDYHDLVADPEFILREVYSFIGMTYHNHTFYDIVNPFPMRDEVFGLVGLHDVRSVIGYRT